ncbi:MAG: hypothetical protein WBV92_03290 [Nitrosotalea sp.]
MALQYNRLDKIPTTVLVDENDSQIIKYTIPTTNNEKIKTTVYHGVCIVPHASGKTGT